MKEIGKLNTMCDEVDRNRIGIWELVKQIGLTLEVSKLVEAKRFYFLEKRKELQ